jgi:hypothetical protein
MRTVLAAALAFVGAAGAPPAATAGEVCDEPGSRALVTTFISAFNRGDTSTLDRLFARGMSWRWYAVGTAPGKRTQGAAYNRKTLVKYFRSRHRKHERLQLLSFRYTGWFDGFAHFEYELLRRADDMRAPRPRTYVGKGAMSCWAGKLSVWSMGEAT